MKIRKIYIFILILSLLFPATEIIFYPYMPETMATHWNGHGQVDGYGDKGMGTFIIPIVYFCVLVPLVIIPCFALRSVEKDERIMKFLEIQAVTVSIFIYAVYLAMLLFNAGIRINFKIFIWGSLILFLDALVIEFFYFEVYKCKRTGFR